MKKGDPATHCRELLKTALLGTEIIGNDATFLANLLQQHPDAARKIGAGVAFFTVEPNPQFGHPEFWLHRIDGTATNFSFLRCLRPSSPGEAVRNALRNAVVADIIEFRDQMFAARPAIRCPITGDPAVLGNCHVDHAPPRTFARLAIEFTLAEGGEEQIPIVDPDGETGSHMADTDQRTRWQEFHRRNAILRVVSVRGNLQGRRRP
jgi:hypothetical protein